MKRSITLILLLVLTGCSSEKTNAYNLSKEAFELEFSQYGDNLKFPSMNKVEFAEGSSPKLDSKGNVIGSIKGYFLTTTYDTGFFEVEIICYVPNDSKVIDDIDCDYSGGFY